MFVFPLIAEAHLPNKVWFLSALVLSDIPGQLPPLIDNANLFFERQSSQTLSALRLLPEQLANIRIFLHFISGGSVFSTS
jgi:hypothetical protein